MTIKRGKTGTGLTEKSTLSWDDKADEADPEIAAILETGTLEGLLASVERECFAITAEAGLPNTHGSFSYNRAGEWQATQSGEFLVGWGIANEIWPIAKALGISEDSLVGFASRMLGDVVWLRRAREAGDHDRAAQMAFYLGVKRAELRLKRQREREWAVGVGSLTGAKEGAARRKEQFVHLHDAIRADFAERLGRLGDETRAKTAVAKEFSITRRHLNRILAKKPD